MTADLPLAALHQMLSRKRDGPERVGVFWILVTDTWAKALIAPELSEPGGPGGVYGPMVTVKRLCPRINSWVVSPVKVVRMSELRLEAMPDSSPVKLSVPEWPEVVSRRNSVRVYCLLVKTSGLLGGAVLTTWRLVATMSESPEALWSLSSVNLIYPVPGASAGTIDGLRDQLYCQGMNSARPDAAGASNQTKAAQRKTAACRIRVAPFHP